MSQISQLQNLARCLLSAGFVKNEAGSGQYLLYVDPGVSFLQCQHWSGNSLTKQELVASSVRPNSTAAYLITPTSNLVVCITPSSNLAAYTYDHEELEWEEREIPAYTVHPDGKLAGLADEGRFHVVYQDPSRQLIYLDNSWSGSVLPVGAEVGSPLSISVVGDRLHVYYISVKDNSIHDVTRENNIWKDGIVSSHAFDEKIKSFMAVENETGHSEFYVMTQDDVLLKVNAEARLMKLGTVKMGKFTSERSADLCANDAWNGTLTEEGLKKYLADDPSCIDNVGGDQSVTPLAAACMRGRLHIVRLLLRYHANPNALSPKKRTPLFYATSSSEKSDRCAIVIALLEAGANVDECYAENGFNTPLMNAISLIADQEVANELLKHGASPTAKDLAGHTVETMAEGMPMERWLSERVEEAKSSPFERQMIEFVVALLMFIVVYTNSRRVQNVMDQIADKLKDINNVNDEKNEVHEPSTVEKSG